MCIYIFVYIHIDTDIDIDLDIDTHTSRCRSPKQMLLGGFPYPFYNLLRGLLFFEKINTEMVWGSTAKRP